MGTRKKLSKSKNFVLADPNDYRHAISVLNRLFGLGVQSLLLSEEKQITGFIYQEIIPVKNEKQEIVSMTCRKFKISFSKLNSLVEKVFNYTGKNLDNFLNYLKKEMIGFETEYLNSKQWTVLKLNS